MTTTTEQTVMASWRGAPPVWVLALARAADSGVSRRRIGEIIGYSPAAISQVINAKYQGSYEQIGAAVRAALCTEAVECPILGEISGEQCLAKQRRPLAATSGHRVRLWRACRGCEHNIGK